MRSRSFACSSFGLTALGMNFFCCVNFFRFTAHPPAAIVSRLNLALCPVLDFERSPVCYLSHSGSDLLDVVGPALKRAPHFVGVLRERAHSSCARQAAPS